MRQFMPPQQMQSAQPAGYMLPRRRRPRRKFRWYLLTIPLVLVAAKWLAQGLEPAFSWDDAMDALRIRERERITQLATLGVIVSTALIIFRIARGPADDK